MKITLTDIVNAITADLETKGFTDEEIAMAITEAQKHYDAYLKKVKNPKPDREEVDEDDY